MSGAGLNSRCQFGTSKRRVPFLSTETDKKRNSSEEDEDEEDFGNNNFIYGSENTYGNGSKYNNARMNNY